MKRIGNSLKVAVGLALLGTLAFGLVAAFQAVSNEGLSSEPTGTPQGYPPPQITVPTPEAATLTPEPVSTPPPSEWAQEALSYVAERYGIPIESLLIANEHTRNYPLIGRTFRAFTLLDNLNLLTADSIVEYLVLIDLTTGEVEEDPAAVEAAEAAAQATADAVHRAKYGKLQPALYDRLQVVSDDAVLPVAIRVSMQGARTEAELYAALAAQFPEAAEAMARGTKPMDVPDPELSNRIQEAYRQLRVENIAARLQPVMDWLRERGFSFESYAEMESASLTTRLPKRTILEVEARDDVELISLVEEQVPLETSTAIFPCGAGKSNQLLFETIEQVNAADVTKQWRGAEPRLLIIASPDDVEEARQFVTDESMLALKQLDFTTHFAILAFQGLQPDNRGGFFQIECILREGYEINLYVQSMNIDPSAGGQGIEVSAYHLIKVHKEQTQTGVYTFKLYFDKKGSAVTSVSQWLP